MILSKENFGGVFRDSSFEKLMMTGVKGVLIGKRLLSAKRILVYCKVKRKKYLRTIQKNSLFFNDLQGKNMI